MYIQEDPYDDAEGEKAANSFIFGHANHVIVTLTCERGNENEMQFNLGMLRKNYLNLEFS